MNPLADDLDHVLAHTQGLWEELRGQRIFITGGTGFFGCWLLESFAWANDKLGLGATAVVLTRNPAAFQAKAPHLASHPAIQFHTGDICSFDFPPGRFSHVIHGATEASAKLNDENPLQMFDTIVSGTRRSLELARHCGAKKFLLTSSGAVYGRQPPELTHVPEDFSGGPSPTEPHWAYGEGKRAAEMLCALFHRQHGLDTRIARCFAFVGPYLPLDIHYAIGNFIRDSMAGGPIRVNGDGSPFRSYLYAADLAAWLWTILMRGAPCRTYNVGSAVPVSIAALAELVAQQVNPRCAVRSAARPDPSRLAQRYVPDVSRVKSELKVCETVDLVSAVRRTIAWQLSRTV